MQVINIMMQIITCCNIVLYHVYIVVSMWMIFVTFRFLLLKNISKQKP